MTLLGSGVGMGGQTIAVARSIGYHGAMLSPRKPLARSGRHRMIAGVCGGIAEWLGWDVTLVRVLYVVVSIFSAAFPGILVYIILMLVMPMSQE